MNRPMHANSFAGAALRQWIDKRTGFLDRRCGPSVEFVNGDKAWCLQGLTYFQNKVSSALRRHNRISGDIVSEDGMTWTANGHPIQIQQGSALKVLEDFPGYGPGDAHDQDS